VSADDVTSGSESTDLVPLEGAPDVPRGDVSPSLDVAVNPPDGVVPPDAVLKGSLVVVVECTALDDKLVVLLVDKPDATAPVVTPVATNPVDPSELERVVASVASHDPAAVGPNVGVPRHDVEFEASPSGPGPAQAPVPEANTSSKTEQNRTSSLLKCQSGPYYMAKASSSITQFRTAVDDAFLWRFHPWPSFASQRCCWLAIDSTWGYSSRPI
jgi:hypothetical protein